ncbi:MAG: CHAT domain-containing protein [Phaeodactylibacter sp.]|nr:CHAT domain-containing protein [Phaeodactylibacter sp.]MCB9295004.1 CHAT domain-containing protein [Lewinellaceae bacterium]
MKDIPVIFLAFADDKDSHLPLLQEEAEDIFRELNPLQNRQHLLVYRDQHADVKKIYHYLTDYQGRVAIFHYAGHANSAKLRFEGQDADARGIAELLALQNRRQGALPEQQPLKLVFLNGCSTREQVRYLLDLGIPAVIATSVEVKDSLARDFAGQFYKALARPNTTVEQAFRSAASLAQSLQQFSPGVRYRGFGLEEEAEGFPWGLYLNGADGSPEARAVLDYKLPLENHREIIVWGAPGQAQAGPRLNERLVMSLFQEFSQSNEEIRKWKEFFGQFGNIEYKAVRAALINIFPAPIGQQFRKLVFGEQESVSQQISGDRLQQIVNTYDVLVRFLFFIMLSQLWEAVHARKVKNIPSGFFDEFEMYLSLRPTEVRFYNFIRLIRIIHNIFLHPDNQVTPFVRELSALKEAFEEGQAGEGEAQSRAFYEAHLFLEDIKHQMPVNSSEEELKSLCLQGENHLATIFTHLGFCLNYKLLTVKSIEYQKARFEKEGYLLRLVNQFRIIEGIEDTQRPSDLPTENRSVILLRDIQDFSETLSLSPFIIDENALTGTQKSKLYFFHHLERDSQGAPVFVYQFSDHLDFRPEAPEPATGRTIRVTGEHFPAVFKLFEHFLQSIRNAQPNEMIRYAE